MRVLIVHIRNFLPLTDIFAGSSSSDENIFWKARLLSTRAEFLIHYGRYSIKMPKQKQQSLYVFEKKKTKNNA